MNYLGTNWGPFCSNFNLYFARNRVILKSRLFTTDDYEFLRKYDGCYRRFIDLGPVVRRPISVNPGLNFNLGFYFSLFKSCLRIIFSIYFQSIQSKNWRQKDFSWIFFFKLSDLKSNFILILGYLNPALNNPALEYKSARVLNNFDPNK